MGNIEENNTRLSGNNRFFYSGGRITSVHLDIQSTATNMIDCCSNSSTKINSTSTIFPHTHQGDTIKVPLLLKQDSLVLKLDLDCSECRKLLKYILSESMVVATTRLNSLMQHSLEMDVLPLTDNSQN